MANWGKIYSNFFNCCNNMSFNIFVNLIPKNLLIIKKKKKKQLIITNLVYKTEILGTISNEFGN